MDTDWIIETLAGGYFVALGTVTSIGGLQLLFNENILYKAGGALAIVSGPLLVYSTFDATLREHHCEKYMPHRLASRGLRRLYKSIRKL